MVCGSGSKLFFTSSVLFHSIYLDLCLLLIEHDIYFFNLAMTDLKLSHTLLESSRNTESRIYNIRDFNLLLYVNLSLGKTDCDMHISKEDLFCSRIWIQLTLQQRWRQCRYWSFGAPSCNGFIWFVLFVATLLWNNSLAMTLFFLQFCMSNLLQIEVNLFVLFCFYPKLLFCMLVGLSHDMLFLLCNFMNHISGYCASRLQRKLQSKNDSAHCIFKSSLRYFQIELLKQFSGMSFRLLFSMLKSS